MRMRRETSRVSFLMCPFCVRVALTVETTTPIIRNQLAGVETGRLGD